MVTVTTLPLEIRAEMDDENDSRTCLNASSYTAKRIIMNYICPSDLFMYCENISTINVNNIFYGSGISSDITR